MLFLLNYELWDVGDPWTTAREIGGFSAPPELLDIVGLGQLAAFGAQGLENAHPEVRRMLATLFSLTAKVNCAEFACAAGARQAGDVSVRLANAPITLMAELLSAQEAGWLTPSWVRERVWRLAAAPSAA